MANAGRVPRGKAGREAQVLDLDVEDISPDGEGIAHAGQLAVHIPFAIPGERVRARVRRGTGPVAMATLLSVLRPSPHRVSPRCRHFGPADSFTGAAAGAQAEPAPRGGCGGCAWQHIAYPEQLRLKTALVDRLVRARVPSAPNTAAMLAAHLADPWGFRQKAHFVFSDSGRRARSKTLLMGHFARGSRRVIGVTECPVHDPRANALAFRLYGQLRHAGIHSAAAAEDAALRSVAVRTATGTPETMVTIVGAHDADKPLRTAVRRVIAATPDTSFHFNVHTRDDGFVFGPRTRTLAGSGRMREELQGSSYLMSPTSFFQTNVAAADLLVSLVLQAMPAPPGRVLDLYAGAGLFSIPLARAGHLVTAVEHNRQAVEDGIASARLNRLTEHQCRFLSSRTEDVLTRTTRVDAIVLDPPRDGCAPGVVDAVFGRLAPPTAVYVSCNPHALALDLGRIVQLGYRIRLLQPVDMFPHTAHIETVAVLAK